MLLTIHDANLQKVAFVDNDKQSTLNYYDDTWTRNLETGSSTFEFTVFKKAIQSDTASQKTYNYLNERAFVSFRYNGKSFLFNVMTVEEDEHTITCYCENLNLELINEYSNPYKATKAMSFVEYCNAMDLLNYTLLTVGINEVSDQKRTLEWEGQETKLARLLSLAKKFDAEIDFETHLNDDSTIKSFKVNVYKENDDTHQGVGRVRNDVQLTYGKNLTSITRKIDKTGVYTMVRPYGKRMVKNSKGEEVEEIVTIGSLSAYSENNKDGVREFYQSGDALYAPIAAQLYPSTFTNATQSDQWIRKDLEVESESPMVIRSAGLRNLKKNAYPAITYEVEGFLDVEIGDTVRIYDDGFTPLLLVTARVSDQKISFTNPKRNRTTFANFKALENKLSDGIQAAFERLFEASKPYLIKLSTDNGVIFKNQIGESLITPSLYKGGKPVVSGVTWRWSLDGHVKTGMTYLVSGRDVVDTVTLTVAAYIGNDEVAVDEISLVNVEDGKLGTPGTPGKDGRTPYLHTAWATNATGTEGFSLDSSINKTYIGVYTDFEPADSTDPSKYSWTLIKGDKGDKGEKGDKGDRGERGLQGLQGAKGDRGIAGAKGADGRTQYTHIAYANSSDGRTGFSVSASNRSYIGMYVDFEPTDSTNPSDYHWTLVKGADGANGTPGKAGADGRTPYLHIAYATSSDGSQGFSVDDSENKTYIGTYTDFVQADSTDYRKYSWSLFRGEDGTGLARVSNYYLLTNQSEGIVAPRQNLLKNVDTLPLGNRNNGTWASVSGGNGTASVVDGDNLPLDDLSKMVRVVNNTNGGNKDLSQIVNLEVGKVYTISCFARVSSTSSQSSVNLLIRSWTTDDSNKKLLKSINHKDWRWYSQTFTTDAVLNYIQFGQNGNGSIEVCGFRLVEGNRDDAWVSHAPQLSYTQRYLWHYRTELYTDGSTQDTEPAVIGVHGEKGDKGDKGDTGADGVAGKDGVGLSRTAIAYARSTSGTVAPSSGWTSTVPTVPAGEYLWTRTTWTYTDKTNETGYSVARIGKDGNTGKDGIAGKDGVGITSTTITYARSTNGTTAPTSGWTATIPTVPNGQYLWTKTVWTYSDKTNETGYSVAKMGEKGDKGDKGDTGLNAAVNITCGFTQGFSDRFVSIGKGTITPTADGWATLKFVNNTTTTQRVEFYLPKPDGLSENQQYTFIHEFRNNKSTARLVSYHVQDNMAAFWGNPSSITETVLTNSLFRVVRPVNLNNNTLAGTTRLVTVNINVDAGKTLDVEARISCYVGNYQGAYIPYQGGKTGPQGIQGLQGPKGDQGIPGVRGADGRTQYTHIAYADNATGGGFSQTDQTKAYIGMYQDFDPVDSPNPTRYRWTKWKGSDGANGIPGAKGVDGKTPYIHFAYAESADGRTGFSTTQTGNKRYIGTYTDYIQADSTDPTKYKWVDMVGTVEVSLDNLLLNTENQRGYHVQNINGGTASQVFSYDSSDDSVVINATGQTQNRWWGVSWDIAIRSIKRGETYAIRLPIYRDTGTPHNSNMAVTIKNHRVNNTLWTYSLVNSTANQWQVHEIVFTASKDLELDGYGFYIYVQQSGKIKIGRPLMVRGNIVPKLWSKSQRDIDADVATKADQALTQEQLNALAEQAQIHEAELQAKASMEALSDLEKAYNAYVKANNESVKKSEKELIEAGRRIELLTTQFGDMKELKTFIDTYMSSSNEGLIIGKNDASSTIKVSHDRISMFSAGREVMYISQGVIHIDNGIFTASVKIGKFITEQYHLNADMNVIRYVG